MADEKNKDAEKEVKKEKPREKEPKGDGKDEGEKKANRKKIIIIGAIIFVVIALQVGSAYLIVNALKGKNPEEVAKEKGEKDKKELQEKMTRIGTVLAEPIPITINVAGDGNHYLKSAIQLEWNGQEFMELSGKITERMAKIQFIIIDILTTKSMADLTSSSGKKRILEQILVEVNSIIPKEFGQIDNVYFTEFIIQ